MREGDGGRDTVFPWCNPPTAEPFPYAVGNAVWSGDDQGRVVSVDEASRTISVAWWDGDGTGITYPADAGYLRKGLPWE